MTALNDIVNALPVEQIAQQLGVEPAAVQQAAMPAITSLLGGMTQNAQNPAGEQALAQALAQHTDRDVLPEQGQANLAAIDPAEGEKILGHVFGNQTDGVANALGGQLGVDSQLVRRLLPILAPIVMVYLANQLSHGGDANGGILGQVISTATNSEAGNQGVLGGVLSQVLGHVLGGDAAPAGHPLDPTNAQATTQAAQARGGDIVSQILGGLLKH